MKSYQFYVHDYLRDTVGLSELEDLIYRRLLDWYHIYECELPESIEACAKIAGMDPSNEGRLNSVKSVLEQFFFLIDGFGWANDTAMNNIDSYQNWRKDKQRVQEAMKAKNLPVNNAESVRSYQQLKEEMDAAAYQIMVDKQTVH